MVENKNRKELKSGYTTGTCAALALRACIRMIFEQRKVKSESVLTPKGVEIKADICDCVFERAYAKCCVIKYAGDDPDVTNGMRIYTEVRLDKKQGIRLDGGEGIGRVTKKGLYQKIGEAAINRVPRQMIYDNAAQLFEEYDYEGGAEIIISAPEGAEIAKKTFNPRLGIEGGISILGTSGIVEPMSEKAITDTIKVEIDVKRAMGGDYLLIAPGNYGIDFIRDNYRVDLDRAVKISNFLGEGLDYAAKSGFKGVMLTGHIGKLIKLSGGIMNTHSRNADSRMELIAANAAMCCYNIECIRKIVKANTTDEAIGILKREGICERVMQRITDRALYYMQKRLGEETKAGIMIFSNEYGILGKSENADSMFEYFRDNADKV